MKVLTRASAFGVLFGADDESLLALWVIGLQSLLLSLSGPVTADSVFWRRRRSEISLVRFQAVRPKRLKSRLADDSGGSNLPQHSALIRFGPQLPSPNLPLGKVTAVHILTCQNSAAFAWEAVFTLDL
ncbi:hypothetical protein SprV_1002803500 [Sparganum proliferum]